MKNNIDFEVLRFLAQFWEARSLPLATNRLNIGVATGFRHLKAAREHFDDPLFVKSGRKMVPTPKMESLIDGIKKILIDLDDLGKSTVFDPATATGPIRIGCIDNAIYAFLLPVIDQIYRDAPNLRISIRPLSENFQTQLAEGKIDLAFYAPLNFKPIEGICFQKLFEARHVYVVRKDHPLAEKERTGRKITHKDLSKYRFIGLKYVTGGQKPFEETPDFLENSAVAMDMPYYITSAFVAMKTDFIVRLPMFTAKMMCETLPLTILSSCEKEEKPWEGIIVWHKRLQCDPVHQWFRAVLSNRSRGNLETV